MIIGLCGPEGAGKTTAARYFSKQYSAHIKPFAGPLKAMFEAMGVPQQHLWGTPEQKAAPLDLLGGKSARQAMQYLGTEFGRDLIDEDLWVRCWAQDLAHHRKLLGPMRLVVCDDLRFANEETKIRELGGCVVRILKGNETTREPKHRSENHWAICADHVITNDGSLSSLYSKLDAVYGAVISGKAGKPAA